MAFNLNGTTITQSGTDNNLSNIDNLSGVNSFQAGNVTIYTTSHRLVVSGTLSIDHNKEILITSSTANNTVEIAQNGTLILGVAESSEFGNGEAVYGNGTSLVIGKEGPGCCSNGPMIIRSGGRLELYNSTIIINGVIHWQGGGELLSRDGKIFSHSDDNNTRIRCEGSAGGDILGLELWGIQFDWLSDDPFIRAEGLIGRDKGIPVENATGVIGAIREWRSVPDYRASADAFCNNWQGQKDLRLINCEIGSATKIVPDSGGLAIHGGRIFHEWDVLVTDSLGNPVQGVQGYQTDTDNGLRVVRTSAGTIDETEDRVNQAETDFSGKFGLQTTMTGMWYRNNDVGDLSEPDGNEVVDVRGKTGVAGEDFFDIGLYKYGFIPATITNVTMNGLQPLELLWTLFNEPTTTEDKLTADSYTSIDNVQQLNNAFSAWLQDNWTGVDVRGTLVGSDYNLGDYDLIIDNNFPDAFLPVTGQTTITTVAPSNPDQTRSGATSTSLNTGSTADAVVAINVTTGNNISNNQVIWESGATGIGTALIVSGNQLEVYAGNNNNLYTSWNGLSANTDYGITIVYDLGNDEIRLYVREGNEPATIDDLVDTATFTQGDWCGTDQTGIGAGSSGNVRGGKSGTFAGSINSNLNVWNNTANIEDSYILSTSTTGSNELAEIRIKSSNFIGSLTTTGNVIDNNPAGTIRYSVTNNLLLNDNSNEWLIDNSSIGNIVNPSGNNLIVNLINGSVASTLTPGTGNNEVNIIESVNVTLTGLPGVGEEIRIFENIGNNEVPVSGNEIAGIEDLFQNEFVFSTSPNSNIIIVILDTGFLPEFVPFTVPNNNASLAFDLDRNGIYLNPL